MWGTTTLADFLKVDRTTIMDWTTRYESYLSDTATPPKGKRRGYTPRDVMIIQFISEQRDQNVEHEDIKAMLEQQVRTGTIPDEVDRYPQADAYLDVDNIPGELVEQIAMLTARVSYLTDQREDLEEQLETSQNELQSAHAEIETLKAELNQMKGRQENVSQDRIEELIQEIAVLKYRLKQAEDQ